MAERRNSEKEQEAHVPIMPCDAIKIMRAITILGLAAASLLAEDWTQFRGPGNTGLSAAKNLPIEMNDKVNLVWKAPSTPGHSSPIVAGDIVFVTGVDASGKLVGIAFDRKNGERRWVREVPRPRQQKHHKASSDVTATPVSDGKNVYAFFQDFGLMAWDLKGNEVWRLPLGPFDNEFGMAASPLLFEDLLIMNCDQDSGGYLLAIDKNTGKQRWKVDRPDFTRSFASPVLFKPTKGEPQVVFSGSYRITAYEARTGKFVWYATGLPWQIKPTPVVAGDTVYFVALSDGSDEGNQEELPAFAEALKQMDANGDKRLGPDEIKDEKIQKTFKSLDYDHDGYLNQREWDLLVSRKRAVNGIRALKPSGTGDITESAKVWQYGKSLPNVPSPLVYDGVVYLLKEGGILTALDATTGKELKRGRLTGALDTYYASPLGADGKLYLLSTDGKLVVVKAGADWELLKINQLDGEGYGSPAVVGNQLFVRTNAAVYCFEQKN
jgi:outer membrane protein assembly factor BamB